MCFIPGSKGHRPDRARTLKVNSEKKHLFACNTFSFYSFLSVSI